MPLSKQQHLDPNIKPKRILSLDGGGIRGILTLEYLGAIEAAEMISDYATTLTSSAARRPDQSLRLGSHAGCRWTA
jgi:hypothetical protein